MSSGVIPWQGRSSPRATVLGRSPGNLPRTRRARPCCNSKKAAHHLEWKSRSFIWQRPRRPARTRAQTNVLVSAPVALKAASWSKGALDLLLAMVQCVSVGADINTTARLYCHSYKLCKLGTITNKPPSGSCMRCTPSCVMPGSIL